MKRGIAILGLLLLVSAGILYFFVFNKKKAENSEQTTAVSVESKHSEAFNISVQNFLNAYYNMTEGFVKWDTAAVKNNAAQFKAALDSFRIDELKADSSMYTAASVQWKNIKAELSSIIAETDLGENRYSLNVLSQLLFELLKTSRYDKAQVYYQECPMALDNYENAAYWLSTEAEMEKRRNPYLGLHDPKYKSGMLKCGSTKDSLGFILTGTKN